MCRRRPNTTELFPSLVKISQSTNIYRMPSMNSGCKILCESNFICRRSSHRVARPEPCVRTAVQSYALNTELLSWFILSGVGSSVWNVVVYLDGQKLLECFFFCLFCFLCIRNWTWGLTDARPSTLSLSYMSSPGCPHSLSLLFCPCV